MFSVYYIVLFFIGASFVSCGNCINYRERNDMDWVSGHSECECCGRQLRFWELVPVVSCVALRARCPRCHCYFGYSHAESEANGGLAVVLLALPFDNLWDCLVAAACFGVIYCVSSYIDGRMSKEKERLKG